MSDFPRYYRPYVSDDEDEEDRGSEQSNPDTLASDYETESDYEDPRIKREEDPRYAIIKAAGPEFNTASDQLKYQVGADVGSDYMINTSQQMLKGSNLYRDPNKTTITSLFTMKSSNRDKSVYPYATNFTLKLPRVYKNVSKFQIVQIAFPNLVNSFTDVSGFVNAVVSTVAPYVPSSCLSSCIECFNTVSPAKSFAFTENLRFNPEDGSPLTFSASISEGMQDGTKIVQDLNREMNKSPPFDIITYDDFKRHFMITKDISVLFAEPGQWHTNNFNSVCLKNPTKDQVIQQYYPVLALRDMFMPTEKAAFIAYYYPVLKEAVGSERFNFYLRMAPYTFEQVRTYVLQQFLGFESDIYYTLCSNNLYLLDNYRRMFTFEYAPVNTYNWSYDYQNKRFSVVHDTLNPSIVKDVTAQYNKIMSRTFQENGLNAQMFSGINAECNKNITTFGQYQQILTDILAESHGVSNVSFSDLGLYRSFYTGANTKDITKNEAAVMDSAPLWKGMMALTVPPYNEEDIPTYQYSPSLENFIEDLPVIDDSTGYLCTEKRTQSVNVHLHIPAGKYAIVKFRSPVNQHASAMTLPVPYKYRYPNYNKQIGGKIAEHFVHGYTNKEMIDVYNILPSDILYISAEMSRDDAISSAISSAKSPAISSAKTFSVNIIKPVSILAVSVPYNYKFKDGATTIQRLYNININVESVLSTGATAPFVLFLYNDVSLCMADFALNRNENSAHYIDKRIIQCGQTSVTFNIDIITNKQYYIMCRSVATPFNNNTFKAYAWWSPDSKCINVTDDLIGDKLQAPSQIYEQQYDIALQNSLKTGVLNYSQLCMNDPMFLSKGVCGNNGLITKLDNRAVNNNDWRGYDNNGISTDIVDYVPILNGGSLYIDPLTGYYYDKSTDTIYDPNYNIYTPIAPSNTNAYKEYKLVYWGDNTTVTSDLLYGFTFLPEDGVYDIKRIVYKSAAKVSDVAQLRVFPTVAADIASLPLASLPVASLPVASLMFVSCKKSEDGEGYWYIFEINDEPGNSINGYTCGAKENITKYDTYSVVAFDADNKITQIKGLYVSADSLQQGQKAHSNESDINVYPVCKITLKKTAELGNNILDKYEVVDKILNNNYNGGGYYKTQLFFYRNWSNFIMDTTGNISGTYKWGQEKLYDFADKQFSGINGNSYIPDLFLPQSEADVSEANVSEANVSGGLEADDYYYIVVRGYSPAEDFDCLLRITLPNRYDYGHKSLNDIITETYDYNTGLFDMFNPRYMYSISTLVNKCNMNVTYNDIGVSISTSSLADICDKTFGYYSSVTSQLSTVSNINSTIATRHKEYIYDKYSCVFPESMLDSTTLLGGKGLPVAILGNKTVIRPSNPFVTIKDIKENDGAISTFVNTKVIGECPINCCDVIDSYFKKYYSCLPTENVINSLSYKMGIPVNSISTFNLASTVGVLGSAINNYNMLMQFNNEQSFNNMDISMPENYNVTSDTTGQVKYVAGKILLNGLGNSADAVSQTVVQNPIVFDSLLGKLDKLSVRILMDDQYLTPVENFFPFGLDFLDWDATFQIDEQIAAIDRSKDFSTVPTVQFDRDKVFF